MALEKDPFVDASQIRVTCRADAVMLTGLVWSLAERQIAENDAWSVFGVGDVENRLFVAELARASERASQG
jgi:osmotically-inducible protein OsmY